MRSGPHAVPASIVLIALLAGCGAPQDADPVTQEYVEPGWMAQARAQEEEYAAAVGACLRAQGQDVEESLLAVRIPTGEDGLPLPGAEEAARAASALCSAQVPEPEYWDVDLEEEYDRLLDVRDCLVDQGYPIPQPPSRDAWVQSAARDDGSWWKPYDFFNDPGNPQSVMLEADEARALLAACTPSSYNLVSITE